MAEDVPMGALDAAPDDGAMMPETWVPPVVRRWVKQAAPQDAAILAGAGRGLGDVLAAPGRALASETPISTEEMIKPAADIAGLTTLGAGAVPAEMSGLRAGLSVPIDKLSERAIMPQPYVSPLVKDTMDKIGIKAYHGSPHDFDRFDISKIGTGEGAQAYGHGLYFAENPKVAQDYRKNLTEGSTHVHFGDPSEIFHPDELTGADSVAARGMLKYDSPSGVHEFIDKHASTDEEAAQAHRMVDEGAIHKADPGRMYEVNIKADPEHFLDWDKQLHEQSPEVQERLNKAWLAHPEAHRNYSGADIFKATQDDAAFKSGRVGYGSSPSAFKPFAEQAAQTLREAGIPGIKYLDQGSRMTGGVEKLGDKYFFKGSMTPYATREEAEIAAEKAGNVTRNYVVFDDKLIDILRKYGWAGLATMMGMQESSKDQ